MRRKQQAEAQVRRASLSARLVGIMIGLGLLSGCRTTSEDSSTFEGWWDQWHREESIGRLVEQFNGLMVVIGTLQAFDEYEHWAKGMGDPFPVSGKGSDDYWVVIPYESHFQNGEQIYRSSSFADCLAFVDSLRPSAAAIYWMEARAEEDQASPEWANSIVSDWLPCADSKFVLVRRIHSDGGVNP